MLTITQIKQLMRAHGLRAHKRLGQNFIIDRNIVGKIVRFADISSDDVVLEIGAGLGNITPDLARFAKKVIAVEFDRGFFNLTKEALGGLENVELICQDILKLDLKAHAQKERLKVVGNIPFYITTPLIEYLIRNKQYIRGALLMVQKELGERLFAEPGNRLYGAISCYLKFYTHLEFKSVVRRTCFFPQPDVDSILLYMKILDAPAVPVRDEGLLFKIIRTAFSQRRKTLLSSLANKRALGLSKAEVKGVLVRASISAVRRPESLGLEEFIRISNEFPE